MFNREIEHVNFGAYFDAVSRFGWYHSIRLEILHKIFFMIFPKIFIWHELPRIGAKCEFAGELCTDHWILHKILSNICPRQVCREHFGSPVGISVFDFFFIKKIKIRYLLNIVFFYRDGLTGRTRCQIREFWGGLVVRFGRVFVKAWWQIRGVRCQISASFGGALSDLGDALSDFGGWVARFGGALSDLGFFRPCVVRFGILSTVPCQIGYFLSVRCQIWAFFSVRCQIWELWENGPVKWGSGGQNKKKLW